MNFEEILSQLPFLRVSKGVIVNISMIKSFRSALSGRLICTLNNDEQIVISRMYVKLLKEKLGVNRGQIMKAIKKFVVDLGITYVIVVALSLIVATYLKHYYNRELPL